MANPSIAQPLWWDAIRPPALSMRPVPQRCDVAIVGAGIAGLSAALALARAGRDVHVFDRQRPGEGTSTRSLGIAHSRLPLAPDALFGRFGEARATDMLREAKAAQDEFGDFIGREGIDCQWRSTGLLVAASRHQHLGQLIREAELLQAQVGIEAEALTAGNLDEVIHGGEHRGGLRRPDAATVHPARLHAALLALARGAGATVHGETGVSRVHRNKNDKFELWTLRGPSLARDVIITSGAYTDRVSPWLRRRLVPLDTITLATASIGVEQVRELLPGAMPVIQTRRLRHVLRPSAEGDRILISARAREPSKPISGDASTLRAALERLFPSLAGTDISHVWKASFAGNRERVPRHFSRNGIHHVLVEDDSLVFSRWLGLRTARAILEPNGTASAFAGSPPGALTLRAGKPWFAPMSLTWQRLADRIDERRERTGE